MEEEDPEEEEVMEEEDPEEEEEMEEDPEEQDTEEEEDPNEGEEEEEVIAAGGDSFCIAANRDSSSLEIATAG